MVSFPALAEEDTSGYPKFYSPYARSLLRKPETRVKEESAEVLETAVEVETKTEEKKEEPIPSENKKENARPTLFPVVQQDLMRYEYYFKKYRPGGQDNQQRINAGKAQKVTATTLSSETLADPK